MSVTGIKTRQYRLRTPVFLAQAAAVQNTWYQVANLTGDLLIDFCAVRMDTLAEDLQARITVDGITPNDGILLGAVENSLYSIYHSSNGVNHVIYFGGADVVTTSPNIGNSPLKCRAFRLQVRKTSAGGANTLRGVVIYHDR